MKKSIISMTNRLMGSISTRYILIFLGCMIILYVFSLFGGMLGSPSFTYAEF